MKENRWQGNPKQEEFLRIPFSIREAAYLGGAGSGKSDVLLMFCIVHQFYKHPRFKQVFMRRTFPELRNEIVPRAIQIYKPFGGTFNKSDMAFTFPSGAMVFLGHCENESDVSKYDSMEINLFTPDEITSFTEYIYQYIGFTRVRSGDPALPAIIRTAGMPGGIGHTWVKKRFVDCAPPLTKITGKGGNKRMWVFATVVDNKHTDPNYAQALSGLSNEAERKAKLEGDFNAYLGQVFDEFRDRHYPDEPENAVHVVKPFNIPDWWPRFVIGDWGYQAQTYIGFFAVSPDKRLYQYREESFVKTKIAIWGPKIKELIELEGPRSVKFCRSAKQDRGDEHTIQEQISQALGMPIDLVSAGPGSRVSGKMLLHEYLRWIPKPIIEREIKEYSDEHANWLLRHKGFKAYSDYISSFESPKPEGVIPKLQIFEDCPLVVNAIKACSYEKSKDNKPAEDVAEFDGDDPYDTIRYACDEADKFFEEAASEFEVMQKRSKILDEFARTQDWNFLFRNARNLEQVEGMGFKPVRRYRH